MMLMINYSSKLFVNWIRLIVFGSLAFVMIVVYIYLSGIHHSDEINNRFDDFVNDKMRNVVKSEVLNRIDEIDYELLEINEEENHRIEARVRRMRELLLSADLLAIKDMKERRQTAINQFKKLVVTDPEYTYFFIDTNGEILFSGTDANNVGKDVYDIFNPDGDTLGSAILEAVNVPEGIFATYYWQKERGGEPVKKTSFCLYIPELEAVIGTGSYEDDVYESLKEKTFERIQSYYDDEENYVFIFGYDGLIHVHGNEDYVGHNVAEFKETGILEVHQLAMEKLKEGSGFISYQFHERNGTRVSKKVSYIQAINEWQIYIGMGYHTTDTVEEIEAYNKAFRYEVLKDSAIAMVLMLITILVSTYFVRKGMKIQEYVFKQDDIVFEQLFELTNEGIIIVSVNRKVLYKNKVIDRIFRANVRRVFTVPIDESFELLDEDSYKYQTENGREYFLRIHVEKMIYQGSESNIFMVENVSKQYIYENELHRMAYFDLLTSLPNRRKLDDDFEDMCEQCQDKDQCKTVLAILDLDNFKNINDTYGHDTGDKVLAEFGRFIIEHIRKTEYAYRYGGEEFVIIFKDIDAKKVQKILAGINRRISKHMEEQFGFGVTFSAGVISINGKTEHMKSIEECIVSADRLLYQAKRNGRNRIEIEEE